jgi:hypothetical protein
MIHRLKTWPLYFKEILDGNKTFDIRKNDRGFKTGDWLLLEEYNPSTDTYTGRKLCFEIGFMLQGEWGLPSDICCMSLIEIEDE